MKKWLLAATILIIGASFASAAQQPMSGTIISESSVACETKTQGKKESTELLCQQSTVRTDTTEYQIRQPKPTAKAILPAGTLIEFALDDQMKFKADGEKYEFLVVGPWLSVRTRSSASYNLPLAPFERSGQQLCRHQLNGDQSVFPAMRLARSRFDRSPPPAVAVCTLNISLSSGRKRDPAGIGSALIRHPHCDRDGRKIA